MKEKDKNNIYVLGVHMIVKNSMMLLMIQILIIILLILVSKDILGNFPM